MADVQAAIRTTLLAHAGLIALVGTRVTYLMLPQPPTLPAVTLQQISGPRVPVMGDDTGVVMGRIQVDIWASSRDSVKATAEQVRDCLERYVGTAESTQIDGVFMDNEIDLYESETLLWRVLHDYRVTWRET